MKISIGSDHAGYDLKETLKDYLTKAGHEVKDLGCHGHESVNYPDYGKAVAKSVVSGETEKGVLVCGSGIGISIAANKIKGARCARVCDPLSAKLSRNHNDANIVAVGSRIIGVEMAKEIVDTFLKSDFEGGRHCIRVSMIEEEQ